MIKSVCLAHYVARVCVCIFWKKGRDLAIKSGVTMEQIKCVIGPFVSV